MKRIISVFASIAALSTMLIMPISVSATGDINANQEDIYEISNANELKWAATQINSDTAKTGMSRASYKLMNDIDLDGAEWTPIGTEAVPFNGTFDGNGYRISNMKVTTPYGDVDISTPCLRNNGFFGNTGTNTKVENLGIDNIYVAIYVHASTCELEGTNGEGMRANCIGGMVGYARGTWTGCYVVNSTIQNTNTDCNEGCGVGAFASFVGTGATIENCYVKNVGVRSGQVKSMGGFFANSSGDINKINNCYSAGVYIDRTGVSHPSVTNDGAFYAFGSSSAVTDNSSKITNCYSTQGNIYAGHTTDPHSITPDTVDANTRGDKLNQEIEDIQAAFIDGNIFIADSHNINNEYPVLASQHINVLNYVYTSLVFDLIKGENLSADNIIRKLSLPQKIYGCNIIWSSSNNDVINSETGTISRNSEDTVVTITAIFSDGADTKTKEFKLTVKKPDIVTYETITSDEGFKYHFFAIDNEDTMRGYVGVYTWLNDDSGFICGKSDGTFYFYDITQNRLEYLDKTMPSDGHLDVYVAGNDRVYYRQVIDDKETLFSIDPKDVDSKRCEYSATEGEIIGIEVTNDGKYTYYSKVQKIVSDTVREKECGRINLETDRIDRRFVYQYEYPYTDEPTYTEEVNGVVETKDNKRMLDHYIINPENPSVFMFAMDDARASQLNDLRDRINLVNLDEVDEMTLNFDSPEVDHYEDGDVYDGSSTPRIRPSHAVWSRDGKYVYLSELGGTGGQRFVRVGVTDTAKFIYPTEEWGFDGSDPGANHGNADYASKWALVDNHGISLLNMETTEAGTTAGGITIITGLDLRTGHPYHGHAEMSASGKIGTWGMAHKTSGVLGVAWIHVDSFRISDISKVGNTISGATVTKADTYTLDEPTELKLYAATYTKDGRFADVTSAEGTAMVNGASQKFTLSKSLTIPTDGYVKLMLWDGVKPIAVEFVAF